MLGDERHEGASDDRVAVRLELREYRWWRQRRPRM
jgi:hypothetical protein